MNGVQYVFYVGLGICAFFLVVFLLYELYLVMVRITAWVAGLPRRAVKWVARIPRRRKRRRKDRHFAALRQFVRGWDDVGEEASPAERETLPYRESVDQPAAVPADRSIRADAG